MKKLIRKGLAALLAAVLLTGCGSSFVPPQSEVPIKPVGNNYIENHYEGVAPTAEPVLETFTSADGLCVIEKKNSYYDVTLDFEKGSHRDVGRAYGEALMKACGDLGEVFEPYLFENIRNAFPNLDSEYAGVKKRIDAVMENIDPDYRDELEGLAEVMGEGRTGFCEDGSFTEDEAKLVSLVADVLRPTACSAISLDGSRTATGNRLNARLLDWDLGSDRQVCKVQCVLRMKNGKKSFVAVTELGVLSALTAVNRYGLMVSEFDVGSGSNTPFECEGRTSYTFDLRHCVENCKKAREAGEYLVKNSSRYTFCVNALLTDPDEALCAELVCTGNEKDGRSLLRDGSTKLNKGAEWGDPNVLCIVNCFVADGNHDGLTLDTSNIVRWKKYDQLFCTGEKLTVGRFKELMSCEKQNKALVNFRNEGTMHMVIADYSDCTLQAVFAGIEKNVDTPEYIDLGSWK